MEIEEVEIVCDEDQDSCFGSIEIVAVNFTITQENELQGFVVRTQKFDMFSDGVRSDGNFCGG